VNSWLVTEPAAAEPEQQHGQVLALGAEVSQAIGKARMASGGTRLVHSREMKVIERYSVLGPEGKDLAMILLRLGRGRLGY